MPNLSGGRHKATSTCSFCGKSQHEGAASPDRKPTTGFFCDECVELLHDIIKKEKQRKKKSRGYQFPALVSKKDGGRAHPARRFLRTVLDDYVERPVQGQARAVRWRSTTPDKPRITAAKGAEVEPRQVKSFRRP